MGLKDIYLFGRGIRKIFIGGESTDNGRQSGD